MLKEESILGTPHSQSSTGLWKNPIIILTTILGHYYSCFTGEEINIRRDGCLEEAGWKLPWPLHHTASMPTSLPWTMTLNKYLSCIRVICILTMVPPPPGDGKLLKAGTLVIFQHFYFQSALLNDYLCVLNLSSTHLEVLRGWELHPPRQVCVPTCLPHVQQYA